MRLTTQRERQLPGLFKVAIVNFQSFDRLKTLREHVDHIGIEFDPRDQNGEARSSQRDDTEPDEHAALRHHPCDQITHPHSSASAIAVAFKIGKEKFPIPKHDAPAVDLVRE